MRLNYQDYLNYIDWLSVNLSSYRIEIYLQGLTEKEFLALVGKIKYYCGKDGVSWLAVYSSTNSDTARITYKKTGKRGRPRKQIEGADELPHIHALITGTEDKSAKQTALKIKKSIDKRYKTLGKKISKVRSVSGRGDHFATTIHYDLKQADNYRTGGSFDYIGYHDTHNYCLDTNYLDKK